MLYSSCHTLHTYLIELRVSISHIDLLSRAAKRTNGRRTDHVTRQFAFTLAEFALWQRQRRRRRWRWGRSGITDTDRSGHSRLGHVEQLPLQRTVAEMYCPGRRAVPGEHRGGARCQTPRSNSGKR